VGKNAYLRRIRNDNTILTKHILMIINDTELGNIDLTGSAPYIIEDQFRDYFLGTPGSEHYRLLAYFSTKYQNTTLLDIGTYKGCSSIALAYNPSNQVKSFDIHPNLRKLNGNPKNIEYIIGNIIDTQFTDVILSSPFILLDTDHDGSFEYKFYEHLKALNWKGTLVLDDIKLNSPMKGFWNSVTEEKYDISNHGHHSGTGVVIF